MNKRRSPRPGKQRQLAAACIRIDTAAEARLTLVNKHFHRRAIKEQAQAERVVQVKRNASGAAQAILWIVSLQHQALHLCINIDA